MRRSGFTVWGAFAVAVLAACSTTACSPGGDAASTVSGSPSETGAPAGNLSGDAGSTGTMGSAEVAQALATLDTVAVKGRAPKTGYSRAEFGQRWRDIDRNGCDTRNDILARDLTGIVTDGSCTVMSGVLDDPYTATTITFARGQGTSEAVQIDHVVALSDAWQKGAQQLTPERREQFANDPLNLLAVDGPANMQKGDGDAATWLPRNRAFRCTYVSTQIAVKASYGLWVTSAERDAMVGVLSACGDAGDIGSAGSGHGGGSDAAGGDARMDPAGDGDAGSAVGGGAPEVATAPAGGVAGGTAGEVAGVYYANCAAARAAGAAPLHMGQPGYRAAMDGDGDGVACE